MSASVQQDIERRRQCQAQAVVYASPYGAQRWAASAEAGRLTWSSSRRRPQLPGADRHILFVRVPVSKCCAGQHTAVHCRPPAINSAPQCGPTCTSGRMVSPNANAMVPAVSPPQRMREFALTNVRTLHHTGQTACSHVSEKSSCCQPNKACRGAPRANMTSKIFDLSPSLIV